MHENWRKLAVIAVLVICVLFLVGGGEASDTQPAALTTYVTDAPPILPDSAEAYGLNLQWSIIGSAEWAPEYWEDTEGGGTATRGFRVTAYGYIYFKGKIIAPVELPSGAEVHQVCFVVDDWSDPGRYIRLDFRAYESAFDDGTEPNMKFFGRTQTTDEEITGWTQLCVTFPDPVLISYWGDLNQDGLSHYLQYNLMAEGGVPCYNCHLPLQQAVIVWNRTISPAPATATFPDVPTTMWAFQYVEALVASGITQGMPDGLYHPYDPVTRAQLATFLSRALGLHWPN